MLRKKVYLLAFQRAFNYGALLQLFALKTVLESNNCDVQIIDYIPPWMKVNLKNQPNIFSFFKRQFMSITFAPFISGLGLTKHKYFCIDDLNKKLPARDFYIVGSDQVWNEKIKGADSAYMLSFAPDEAVKIGYAISMGNEPFKEENARAYYSNIKRFDFLSVRESFVSKYLDEIKMTDNDMPLVLDPTLLLDDRDYNRIIKKESFSKKYILAYACMHDKNLYEYANRLKEITGLQLVNTGYHFPGPDKHEYLLGPDHWVARIKHAEYIITNSFHGTAFSILFRKRLFVIPNLNPSQKGLNARFVELLSELGMVDRLVTNFDEIMQKKDKNTDYELVHERLRSLRQRSLLFINSAIGLA